jgi:hypothetical protein
MQNANKKKLIEIWEIFDNEREFEKWKKKIKFVGRLFFFHLTCYQPYSLFFIYICIFIGLF